MNASDLTKIPTVPEGRSLVGSVALLGAAVVASLPSTAALPPINTIAGTTSVAEEQTAKVREQDRFTRLDHWRLTRQLATELLAPNLDALVRERSILLNREMERALTGEEQRRLAYVVWKLDAIEDAEMAPALDRLERLAEAQEKIARLVAQMRDSAPHTA